MTLPHTSPCTGICKLDDATGWCLGCGRSGTEIGAWRSGPVAWREAVWNEIPSRLGALGVPFRRLNWRTRDIRDYVADQMQTGRGMWEMGPARVTGPAHVIRHSDDVIGHAATAAIRVTINEDVRALSFEDGAAPRVALAVKRERGRLPALNALTDLGPDRAPLIAQAPGRLFDLGLGRKDIRIAVRVSPGPLQTRLMRSCGQGLAMTLDLLEPETDVTVVVETALGRCELPADSQIKALANAPAWSSGTALPRAYLPGAFFLPAP